MKCSWGGCQTEAIATVQPVEPTLVGDYERIHYRDPRPACRNHMAIICQDYTLNVVETL